MSNEKLKNKVIDDEKLEKVSGGSFFDEGDEGDENEFHQVEPLGVSGIGEGNWNSKPEKNKKKYSAFLKR